MTETFSDTISHGSFTLERTFDHPVRRVWRAWSDMSVKKLWFHGGDKWIETERTLDFRIGGKDIVTGKFTERPDPRFAGASRYVSTFHDIEPEQRIINVYDMWIDGKYLSCSLSTILFHADGDKTHLTLTEQGTYFDGPEHNENRKGGTAGHLDNMASLFDSIAADEAAA